MDFEFIREQTPLYIEAAKLTLHMAVIGVLLAIVVGLVCSMISISGFLYFVRSWNVTLNCPEIHHC